MLMHRVGELLRRSLTPRGIVLRAHTSRHASYTKRLTVRETCLFCVSKHLSQSIILMSEVKKGYPMHLWYAVGHLAEAEDESVIKQPKLSAQIRKVRLALMGQEGEYKPEEHVKLLYAVRHIASGSLKREARYILERV